MIYDTQRTGLPLRLNADLCIIGSGAGGAAAAAVAAEAGLSVVVLESGPFVPPSVMTQREEQMLPLLLEAGGALTTTNRQVTVLQGRALGGSTVHNLNLCKRIPDPILREWERTHGMEHLTQEVWSGLYDELEKELEVTRIEECHVSDHNLLLKAGAQALGWKNGQLYQNRSGCVLSGFCALGCAYDAKNNAVKVFIPRALRAGAEVITHCKAVRILTRRGEVTGVEAVAVDPGTRQAVGRVEIVAPRVCVAASATGTAALLLRSKIESQVPVGRSLTMHPGIAVAGEFEQPVEAWKGIPQSYECTEFLDFEAAHPESGEPEGRPGCRTWILPAFAHPMAMSTMMPGWGAHHRELMGRYQHLAVFSAMIHDSGQGQVKPNGDLDFSIQWQASEADGRELNFGLKRLVELMFAAGARQVYVPTRELMRMSPGDDLRRLDAVRPADLPLTAVHPMSTVPMGDRPDAGVVDSRGQHHRIKGLWVADGSLFPTSIGVPPQMSIYAMGLHVGRGISA